MFRWAVIFFVIAIVAAFFGFSGLAVSAAGAARITFVVALILGVVSIVMHRQNA
ncbi:MAG: DUF1328 domain-containing protein [Deltaproteobacteria bacterium]|nr:DUF1328 domain-containing protein [Deltaproteobacteria bacterium]